MRTGSIVETVANFNDLEITWGFSYPKRGDVLTISSIKRHHNASLDKKGIVLLCFEELPNLVPLCDKTLSGIPNFIELILPDDIKEILEMPLEKELLYV